nr:CPBP family intramembrane glutamic endopeptidase [Lentibacter algarum]
MSFCILGGSVVLAVGFLHARSPLSLIGNLGRAVPQFAVCFGLLVALLVALEFVPPWWSFDALETTRPLLTWLALLPVALFAILVQIGSEELLYRGYLQQQLAVRFAHPLVWMLIPSLLFGFAHWSSTSPIAQNTQYVVWAFFFGLAASDLTARAGTLGPALALHLANNAFAFLLYAEHNGPSSGFALLLFPSGSMGEAFETATEVQAISWQLFIELCVLFVMWLTARLALKR